MKTFKIVILVAAATLLTAPAPASACECQLSARLVCASDPAIVLTQELVSFDLRWTEWPGPPTSFTLQTDDLGDLAVTLGGNVTWDMQYFGELSCIEGGPTDLSLGTIYVTDHERCGTTPACPVSLPEANPFCPSRPVGNPRAECELFGLTVLDKNDGTSGLLWSATTDARLALVKAGGCYQFYVDVKAGDPLATPNGQGISHVTYCGCPDPQ